MKKIRVLLLLLVVLMIPCIALVACNTNGDDAQDCTEGHTWRNASNPKRQKLIQSRTCTLPEIRERECRVCGAKEQYVSADPAGHRYDSTKKIYLNDATCTENGHTINQCYWYDRCGYTAALIEEVPGTATGHTFLYYEPDANDPSIGIAKCTDCDATDKKILGFKMDMEGDRSHLSYSAMSLYVADAQNAYEYKTVGEGESANTYLLIKRPATGYIGGSEFGVVLAPNYKVVKGAPYVFEATLIVSDTLAEDIKIVANKNQLNQSITLVTYNAADKTIDGMAGAVYGLDADDFANGVKISLVLDDQNGWYQIYVNNVLVSDPITYVGDYFAGFDLGTIEIQVGGSGAAEFGLDDIFMYAGNEPDGFVDSVDKSYVTITLDSGEKLNIKAPVDGCAHQYSVKRTKAAACGLSGYTVEECSECKGQRVVNVVAPLEHDHVLIDTVPPTCFTPGYDVYECTVCGGKLSNATAGKLEHKHGDDVTIIDATCESNEIIQGNCMLCGTYFEVEVEGTQLSHELGDSVVVTLPTCSTDGYTSGPCKHCGENYVDESTIVKAFGHYAFEYTHIEANCSTEGCTKYICQSCGLQQVEVTAPVTGHKTYSKVSTSSGKTTVTYACVNCEYSYSYTAATGELLKYSELADKIKYSYYQDDKASSDMLLSNGGDYNKAETVNGIKNCAQWVNGPNNKYGVFIGGKSGADGYINFPVNDQGIKVNTVWEFDVKFPDAGLGDAANPQYENGGVSISFSTNAGNVGGSCMKIYPDGSIVGNNWLDGSAGFGSTNMSGNKTTWDVAAAPKGTVNNETWTRVAIALDMTNKQYSIYINGALKATIDLPEDFGPAVRYIRLMVIHTGEIAAIMYRNMFYHHGDTPLYMTAPSAPENELGASFQVDPDPNMLDSNGNLIVMKGSFDIYNKQGFNATLDNNKLAIKAGQGLTDAENAGSGVNSYIEAETSFRNKIYTVNTKVTFNKVTGDYSIVRLKRGSADTSPAESIVYINDGKIKVFGSDWTYTLTAGETVEFNVVVKDGTNGDTFDLYINGKRVAEAVSFDDTALGNATSGNRLQMFYVNSIDSEIDITVSAIKVNEGDIINNSTFEFENAGNQYDTRYDNGTEVKYLIGLGSALDIQVKQHLKAYVVDGALEYKYDPAIESAFLAGTGTDSSLTLSLADYKDKEFVYGIKFTPNAVTGEYDVVAIERGEAALTLVSVANGKLVVFGNETDYALVEGKEILVEVFLKDGAAGDLFAVYVNGECVLAETSFDSTDVGAADADTLVRMFRVTDADQVIDITVSEISVYKLNAITDSFETAFALSVDGNEYIGNTNYISKFSGGKLSVVTKQNFKASLTNQGKLSVKYDEGVETVTGAQAGTDSHLYIDVTGNTLYTLNIAVAFNSTNGDYDIVKLSKDGAETSIVYVKDEKIRVYGSEWTFDIPLGPSVKVDFVYKNGGISVYVDGILVIDNIAFGQGYTTLKLFNVNDPDWDMDVIVDAINMYSSEIVPSYYVGKLVKPNMSGYKDVAVSFDGTENIVSLLPANTKIPGGYYYEEIATGYLSLAKVPATEKVPAAIKYVKVSGSGVVGAEDGYWTLGTGNFKTNGHNNLNLYVENLPVDLAKGYDISGYSKMIVRFYVNDTTAGYKFTGTLVGSENYNFIDGKSYGTGWHVVEIDLADAPDFISGIRFTFDGANDGVDGNINVDGFNFYLENISFEAAGYVIEDLEYIYKPLAKKDCEGSRTGHVYGDAVTVEGNCGEQGYVYKVCTVCDYMHFEATEKPAHEFEVYTGEDAMNVPPSCESMGAATYVCDCGMITVKFLGATGHNFVKLEDATAEDGYVAATCTESGIDVYVCAGENCEHNGKKFYLVTEKLGHTKADDATETVVNEATCTDDGLMTVSKCATCGEAYDVVLEAIGHDYEEVVEYATCTENGRSYEKCANCGDEKNELMIPATGHNIPAKYLHVYIEETCNNPAGWTYECLTCGGQGLIPDDDDGLPRPHSWDEYWVIVTTNTCGENGHRDKTCGECGGLISELGTDAEKAECVIPATGAHTWSSEWTYSDDYVEGVRGEKWHDCTEVRCQNINDLQGAGTYGLEFTYNNKNAYVITDYHGTDKDIVIPAIFKGLPVMVGDAFVDNTVIESVTMAEGVLISAGAFKGCTALKSVVLPADLVAIPTDAFYGCVALETIELPASCTVIKSGAFYGCTALETIVINGTLTQVQMAAFGGCNALTTVKYVNGTQIPYIIIAEMGNEAFLNADWTAIDAE